LLHANITIVVHTANTAIARRRNVDLMSSFVAGASDAGAEAAIVQ
jgi:hypothetical protein